MLPFLKNRDDGVGVGPIDSIERKPDDDTGMDLLDAVADDMLAAVKKGDKALLRQALEAFVDHIQSQDVAQDQEMAP